MERKRGIALNKTVKTVTIVFSMILIFSSMMTVLAAPKPAVPVLLDPKTIPKYTNQLVANIPVYTPTSITAGGVEQYSIDMVTYREQILPTGTILPGGSLDGQTNVWGYAGQAIDETTGLPVTTPGYPAGTL